MYQSIRWSSSCVRSIWLVPSILLKCIIIIPRVVQNNAHFIFYFFLLLFLQRRFNQSILKPFSGLQSIWMIPSIFLWWIIFSSAISSISSFFELPQISIIIQPTFPETCLNFECCFSMQEYLQHLEDWCNTLLLFLFILHLTLVIPKMSLTHIRYFLRLKNRCLHYTMLCM